MLGIVYYADRNWVLQGVQLPFNVVDSLFISYVRS